MDLLNIVSQPTWREFLVDLITSEQMDPWDIDLVQVSQAYLEKVRQLNAMDLRVPANVILASAILLRFKSDSLNFDEEPLLEEGESLEARELISEDIPELVLRTNNPRKRSLTLDELITAVEEVMSVGKKKMPLSAAPKVLSIELPKENMNERMQKIYSKAIELMDSENVVLFSSMLNNKNDAEEITLTLLPLLHLAQEQKLLAWQDEFFGEIFIKVQQGENTELTASLNQVNA